MDVHRKIADEESWTLVVNDVVKRVLYVMNIPASMLAGINIRDEHDKYTLRFNASNFITSKTNSSLQNYIVQKLKY